jgi:hypothetical protein
MTSTSTSDSRLLIDDYYFSALCDDEEVFPISDEKYAQELQLQEALMSSAIFSTMKSESRVEEETGESSQSFYTICIDGKPTREMVINNSCTHSFCIQENISTLKWWSLQTNRDRALFSSVLPNGNRGVWWSLQRCCGLRGSFGLNGTSIKRPISESPPTNNSTSSPDVTYVKTSSSTCNSSSSGTLHDQQLTLEDTVTMAMAASRNPSRSLEFGGRKRGRPEASLNGNGGHKKSKLGSSSTRAIRASPISLSRLVPSVPINLRPFTPRAHGRQRLLHMQTNSGSSKVLTRATIRNLPHILEPVLY